MAKAKKVNFRKKSQKAGVCKSLSRKQAVAIYGKKNVSVDYNK